MLQINDIRYDIFHLVMTYLYNGGLGKTKVSFSYSVTWRRHLRLFVRLTCLIQVDGGDVLELMAAANFFQLPGLLRHCEALCARIVDLDNIVSYYIHAKVCNNT